MLRLRYAKAERLHPGTTSIVTTETLSGSGGVRCAVCRRDAGLVPVAAQGSPGAVKCRVCAGRGTAQERAMLELVKPAMGRRPRGSAA